MSTRRRLAFGATAVAVALTASTGPVAAQAPPPDEEVVHSWALAPAGSDDPGEAGNRPALSYTADPGGVVEDAVTLYNLGNQQLTFRVYATDAFNNDAGQFDILPGDEAPTGVGAWISVPQEFVQVPPGQQVTMPITLSVPEDAAPGDHAGAIVAASEALSTGDGGDTVSVERRTGTRVYLRVNGPLRPELTVDELSTSYDQSLNPLAGSATVTYRVSNTGNVRLAGTSTVSVSGPFGLAEQRLPATDVPELLPGEDVVITTESLDDVPAFGAVMTEVELETASADGVESTTVNRSATTFAPPIALLLLLLAFLFALIGMRALRRHRTDSPAPDAGVEAQPEPEPQPT